MDKPTRHYYKFAKDEIEFILTLTTRGFKPREISRAFIKRFNQEITAARIAQKISQMKKKGVDVLKNCRKQGEIVSTYEAPNNCIQAKHQLDVVLGLLTNLKSYLEKANEVETNSTTVLLQMEKMKKILSSEKTGAL